MASLWDQCHYVNLPHFSGGVPYYPFLAELSRPEELMDKAEELPRVRVLACSECTEGLHSQWAKYQGENVPIEERNYFYQVGSLPNSINQHLRVKVETIVFMSGMLMPPDISIAH